MKTPVYARKEGQNPKGGLNAKGRAAAKAEGMNLKPPVNSVTIHVEHRSWLA